MSGGRLTGLTVHIAALVSATAAAGEVLVSRTVTELVAGAGFEFSDLGERELKGVPGSWRLFALDVGRNGAGILLGLLTHRAPSGSRPQRSEVSEPR